MSKQLAELFDYKNKLMEDLLTNESIVKLIAPGVSLEDAKSLAYNNVFPLEYVPETVEEAKTFVCFDVEVQKSINKTFHVPTIYVWVYSHKSLLRLPEGGVRPDKLISEIAEVLDGSHFYGLGELDLSTVRRYYPTEGYQGKVMTFYTKEFSRTSANNKPIPSNRKLG